jgi:putative tryptophan/tyrosine transport system substrate-binding protein
MTIGIGRRQFMSALGGVAAAWPLAARAQEPMPVIGFLGLTSADVWADNVRAFKQGLSETGYVEGQNVAIEYRWAEDQNNRLPALAADLVSRRVTVIVAGGATPAAMAAKSATATIPIVFQIGTDPVALGFVSSLSRPGGNLTGVSSMNQALGQKRLEVLHELVPTTTTMAVLINPNNPTAVEDVSKSMLAAARALGLQLHVLRASNVHELDAMFATLGGLRVDGLVITPDPVFSSRSEQLAELTTSQGVPAISPFRAFAAAGGLMSYGGSLTDQYRLVGIYTGRILKGEKPADLPVQQSTKIELTINLRTAKALGLTVPLPLLGRADEVIE